MTKLDTASRKDIESKAPIDRIQTYDELMKLEERVRVLEAVTPSSRLKTDKSCKTFVTTSKIACGICRSDHPVFKCKQLIDLSDNQRLSLVHKSNLCINCLSNSHRVANCRSGGCKICQKRHHTLLHIKPNTSESQSQQSVINTKGISSDKKGKRSKFIHNDMYSETFVLNRRFSKFY